MAAVLLAGCGVPRDPEGTLDRVRGGTLRAGISQHEPWTRLGVGQPSGVEVRLVVKAIRLEWFSIAYLLSAIALLYLTLGSSQAMKATWVEDILGVLPPLGRIKQPLARELHDKVLFADAEMNRADWMTGVAAMLGVVGIGLGLWWADPLPKRIEHELRALPWVRDAEVRLREEGHVFIGEAFVVPVDDEDLVGRLDRANQQLRKLDWRLHELVIAPVPEIVRPEPAGGAPGGQARP